MTLSELQKQLAKLKRKHGDVEVIFCCYSDYAKLEAEGYNSIKVVEAWHIPGSPHVSREKYAVPGHREKEQATFVCFPGN